MERASGLTRKFGRDSVPRSPSASLGWEETRMYTPRMVTWVFGAIFVATMPMLAASWPSHAAGKGVMKVQYTTVSDVPLPRPRAQTKELFIGNTNPEGLLVSREELQERRAEYEEFCRKVLHGTLVSVEPTTEDCDIGKCRNGILLTYIPDDPD